MQPAETTRSSWTTVLTVLFHAIPLVVLGLMVLFYVRTGVDLPYYDDWRDYARSMRGTMSLDYLFRPSNDTLYPVGRLLDSLALDALNGNTVAYQVASMATVLGLILIFQWKLLSTVLEDRLLAASAFLMTLLTLQTGSYWGRQYIAYHQAIPLVCFLFILYVLVCATWRRPTKNAAIFLAGLIAGLAYISGAFGGLGGAAVLLTVGLLRRHRRDILEAGLALGAAALMTALAQAYVIVVVQHGGTHRPDTPWATPLSLDFWIYALGKIARSLGLPPAYPAVSLALAVVAVATVVFVTLFALFKLLRRSDLGEKTENRLCVTLFLTGVLTIYLLLVTAGRANMRMPGSYQALQTFVLAFARFHFFWLTLIWPWMFAALLAAMSNRLEGRAASLAAIALAPIIAALPFLSGNFDHRTAFAETGRLKADGIACIQRELIMSDQILCPLIYPGGLTNFYTQAVGLDAPFTRSAPPSLRAFNDSPKLTLFDGSEFSSATASLSNAGDVAWQDNSVELTAKSDTSIQISTADPDRMGKCVTLYVKASIDGAADSVARLSFKPSRAAEFSTVDARIAAGGPAEFLITRRQGFADSLRLNPTSRPGSVRVSNFTVRCLVEWP